MRSVLAAFAFLIIFPLIAPACENDSIRFPLTKYNRILHLMPLVEIDAKTSRPPIFDFVEAELSAGLDYNLEDALFSFLLDSSRVISINERNTTLYTDHEPEEINQTVACEITNADAVLSVKYLFVNMPMPWTDTEKRTSEVSELRADFFLYDCAGRGNAWEIHHMEFISKHEASYNELMNKMMEYLQVQLHQRSKK